MCHVFSVGTMLVEYAGFSRIPEARTAMVGVRMENHNGRSEERPADIILKENGASDMQTMRRLTWPSVKDGQTGRKIDPRAFGLTTGILWGVGLFSLTWWIIAFEGSSKEPTAIGRLYRGYTVSPRGSVVGLVWAFFDALIGGACFAWLYNKLAGSRKSQ
jgi:hypothetical protein